MKSLIIRIITNPSVAQVMINPLLRLHNFIYQLISVVSIAAENGTHPKHGIIRYHEWFLARVNKNSIVVDIGSNTGSLLGHLAGSIKQGCGIEILKSLHDTAVKKNKAANLQFINADATQFDFFTVGDVNTVTLSNVLEHIRDRVDFLKKIIRSLKGRHCVFLIRVPLITRDWLACYKKARGVDYRLDLTHFTEYTEQEIRDELTLAGLRITEVEIRFGEIFLACEIN